MRKGIRYHKSVAKQLTNLEGFLDRLMKVNELVKQIEQILPDKEYVNLDLRVVRGWSLDWLIRLEILYGKNSYNLSWDEKQVYVERALSWLHEAYDVLWATEDQGSFYHTKIDGIAISLAAWNSDDCEIVEVPMTAEELEEARVTKKTKNLCGAAKWLYLESQERV